MNNIYIYLKKSFISLYTTIRKFDECYDFERNFLK